MLVTHRETFGEVLSELEETGRLQRATAGRGAQSGRFIPVGDSFAEIDIDIWNRVIDAARPVNTELLEPFTSASSAMRYERFRHFLGTGEGQPQWKAVASDYNLRRDFESKLLQRVQSALEELGLPEPMIVAGQTATGKTIALCALALEVARSGRAAVLHRSVRGERPTLGDIEAFASWADRNHGLPTLLVWDRQAKDVVPASPAQSTGTTRIAGWIRPGSEERGHDIIPLAAGLPLQFWFLHHAESREAARLS